MRAFIDYRIFRNPDADSGRANVPGDESGHESARAYAQKNDRGTGKNPSRETWAAVALEERGLLLGALQVTRPDGPEFTAVELESLKAIGGVISSSLLAAHRIAVERFRHNQLNLVREVSAQIANVMNVDDLSRRVTGLIQKTFHYYYVAIFTLRRNSTSLQFRASAMPKIPAQEGKGRRSRPKAVALDVEIGQGLIGEAAASGERTLVADVRQDAALSLYRCAARDSLGGCHSIEDGGPRSGRA